MELRFRILKGTETTQYDAETTLRADPDLWYWEPLEYKGLSLWSRGRAYLTDVLEEAVEWQLEEDRYHATVEAEYAAQETEDLWDEWSYTQDPAYPRY